MLILMPGAEIRSRLQGARLHLDDAYWLFAKRKDFGRGAKHLRAAIEQLKDAAARAEDAAGDKDSKQSLPASTRTE
jgi:hypothetical protein